MPCKHSSGIFTEHVIFSDVFHIHDINWFYDPSVKLLGRLTPSPFCRWEKRSVGGMLKYIQLTNVELGLKICWPEPQSRAFATTQTPTWGSGWWILSYPPKFEVPPASPRKHPLMEAVDSEVLSTQTTTNSPALCVTLLKLPKFSGPQFPYL